VQPSYSYSDVLRASERAAFRLDDVIDATASLDFGRPFLPEPLARVRGLSFLDARAQRTLNHVRAHAYLGLFGLVEEFILPFVLDHARSVVGKSDAQTRALLSFASEEAKHIALFRRFSERFALGFGSPCELVGPPRAVADAVLAHAPLGVSLVILHIEWMTQRHYLESVHDDEALDPHFRRLLKCHFAEECQHAKLDTLITLELASRLGPSEIEAGVDDYFAICEALDGLLQAQVELDLASLERALGRTLRDDDRTHFRATQLAANRFTYLGSGMRHPSFTAVMRHLSPRGSARLRAVAERFV